MSRTLRYALGGVVVLLSLSIPSGSVDATTAKELQIEPWVVIGDTLRQPIVELPEVLQGHFVSGQWAKAVAHVRSMKGPPSPALAFVEAWSMIQSGVVVPRSGLIEQVELAPVPQQYRDFVVGTLLWEQGKEDEASARFAEMPAGTELEVRARVARAVSLLKLKRDKAAVAVLKDVDVSRVSDTVASQVLLQKAIAYGVDSQEGLAELKALSIRYPNSRAAYNDAALKLRRQAGWATWQELSLRVEALARSSKWNTIIEETEPFARTASRSGIDGCRFHYVRGRAIYKRNRLKDSMNAMSGLGEACKDLSVDYGARTLYLRGYAAFRRSELKTSATAYRQIAMLYPDSSYADDGLTRAGIAYLEAGNIDEAQVVWKQAVEKYPQGDTVPEASWRLAWTSYLKGDTPGAIAVAEKLGASSPNIGGRFVDAGRYWSARWRLFPDVENPKVKTQDEEDQKEALRLWEQLCKEKPHSFYSMLAYSRMVEEAPGRAAALLELKSDDKVADTAVQPWFVRLSFLEDGHIRDGVALARVGLIREALLEWDKTGVESLEAAEMAWLTELRWRAGDWLLAHDAMRQWMKSNPAGTLGPYENQVLRVAYPDQYWREVKAAAEPMEFEPRMFHALVREESNFNRSIVSYAGARGLSQVMPGTALQTAKWLGKRLDMKKMFEPQTNLEIGAKYLDVVYKQTGESPFLALAAYNAGPGRVMQWVDRFENAPIDEYVESIPIRQTRIYVKRVMESWQTYRWHFDDGPGFPDLSRFNHQAKLDSEAE